MHKSLANHIVGERQNWNAGGCPLRGASCCISRRKDHIHGTVHQIGRMDLHSLWRQPETGCIDHEVFAFDEAEPPQFIEQRDIMRCIAWARKQGAEAIDASGFLPASDEWPCRRRASEQRDELATPHSITSSASESRLSDILTPRAFAVLRLMISSNLLTACTGMSTGFAPLRIFDV